MTTNKTGGPAFPVFPDTGGGHAAAFQGMTLRDYFAAKAMQAIIQDTGINIGDGKDKSDKHDAEAAYRYADAMLKAREL